jgi:small-conductance mechanosensitive channel
MMWFPWLPAWVVALAFFLLVLAVAVALQGVLIRLVTRLTANSNLQLRVLFLKTRTVARFAFVILAAALAVPLVPVDPATEFLIQRILVSALVILFGWVAMVAAQLVSDRYIMRFKIDAADNLQARAAITQFKSLNRLAQTLIVVITLGLALMTFPSVRQLGVSLFASAGIVGVIIGVAAQSTIGNVLAGIQLAITQPIRIDDVVIVEGEWGRIEEINSTFVVVRIWDLRRLVVPLSYFLQQPFQNWTRTSATVLGTVFFYLDYATPVDAVRAKVEDIVRASPMWDGDVVGVQVTNCNESTMEIRALISARDSGNAWNLRCELREKMLAFLKAEHPQSLPRQRSDVSVTLDARNLPKENAPAGPV